MIRFKTITKLKHIHSAVIPAITYYKDNASTYKITL